ncbi:GNAT family N-acetyltransferase [Weissella soli]|uniref:GNAT family N-acetyltransferase n=1 Tax=Weissella soli TaxID=155866 RepID=UPI0021C110B4|nr:N-acetyltransferase [Weissella soli]
MESQRFDLFESVVAQLNLHDILPIISGSFALEIISGYNLNAYVTPMIIEDEQFNNAAALEETMYGLGFSRADVVEPVFLIDQLTIVFIPKSSVEELIGHELPSIYNFVHTMPDYFVLNTYDLFNVFAALIASTDRDEDSRQSDARKLRFMQQLGYIFDRYPVRQLSASSLLNEMAFHFATPQDYTEIDQVIRRSFDEATYSTLIEEQQVRALRIEQPNGQLPIEIVIKFNNQIIGYGMLSDAQVAENRDAGRIGVLGPVVIIPEFRGRGLGWRLAEELEVSARYAGYAAVIVMGWPNYWRRFGYHSPNEIPTTLQPRFNMDLNYFMVKDLYPGALMKMDGEVTFPKAWGYNQNEEE